MLVIFKQSSLCKAPSVYAGGLAMEALPTEGPSREAGMGGD